MSTPTAPKLPRPPRWMIYLIIISVVASWVPLGWIAVARTARSPKTRIHLIQDMDVQPKYTAQDWTPLFQDRRAARLPIPGTVARGELRADDHFYRGYATDPATGKPVMVGEGEQATPKYFDGFPQQVKLTEALLERGRERYMIFCAPCHGPAGYGDGLVNQRAVNIRAVALATGNDDPAAGWVPPRNLHTTNWNQNPAHIYRVISEGFGKMMPYDSQIEPMDRWAVVAFVKTLQFAQSYPAKQLADGVKPADFPGELPKVADAPAAAAPGAATAVPTELPPGVDPKLVAAGKAVFMGKGICFTCHQAPGNPPSPPLCPSFLDGIVGKPETVTIGLGGPEEQVVVDEAYFRESLKNPTAKIVVNDATGQAYQPIMPPIPLTDDEITALWHYVQSFGPYKKK